MLAARPEAHKPPDGQSTPSRRSAGLGFESPRLRATIGPMSPDVASHAYTLLSAMLESCHAIERLVPDGLDRERLGLRALEANVTEALGVVREEHPEAQALLRCSFCGKAQAEVAKLIAGRSAHICNECIDLCDDIVQEERNVGHATQGDAKTTDEQSDAKDLDEPSSVRRTVPPPRDGK